ncbi:Aste57867_25341 [Aphanomyces stellatus]|uniref:Aste57867_25341 protein n=1 Tax=Aphanomyces stellatus TaxID=120398 RepID=A0A485LXL7_9STRA|nr:hypothetical protein As57867_025263 [Aphanomyces stellatus]VFU01966.1 Aste57867_25341 [Aphanomyces stellatus]
MRGTLQAKGSQQFSELRTYFQKMDKAESGLLVRREVETALNYFGLFPTSHDLGTLMRLYGPHSGATSLLAWRPFVDALEGHLSSLRAAVVRKSYDAIVAKCNNRSVGAISALGRFDQHPLALRGITPADILSREFATGLIKAQDACEAGAVTPEVFEKYYGTISHTVAYDDDFVLMMQGVWGAAGLILPPQAPIFGGHKFALLKKLEEKTHDTEKPRAVLVRVLKKFDKAEKGYLSQREFAQAIEAFGFVLSDDQMEDTFRRGETNKEGKLRADWFADYICT